MVTLSELVAAAKQRADLEGSNFIRPAEARFMVNSSAAELYGLLVSSYEDYFTTSFEFSIASDEDGYSLPFVFHKLRGLDLSSSGTWININRFNFEERNSQNRPLNLDLIGVKYRVVGSRLMIIPADQAAGNYRMWYIPKFVTLEDGDSLDENTSMEYWYEYIVVDAAIKMAQKEESDAVVAALMMQKMALKTRIEEESANRDAAQPERVTDIHAHVGEDFFWRS